jgi:hypothetical protein
MVRDIKEDERRRMRWRKTKPRKMKIVREHKKTKELGKDTAQENKNKDGKRKKDE